MSVKEGPTRFGCGFVLGVLVSFFAWFSHDIANGYYLAAVLLVFGTVFGLLSLGWGHAFWRQLRWIFTILFWR